MRVRILVDNMDSLGVRVVRYEDHTRMEYLNGIVAVKYFRACIGRQALYILKCDCMWAGVGLDHINLRAG